ncbi:retrotransposon protein, putative, ty1-copia subclass [Tanacetum coccineum]|uniref:Retrotransposon protein, putative, ty1-copia subclass n=1 Tax=Tanacetum coccineum TaxID=301880 RepID=A0ABQ5FJA7_9ASTR
MERGFLSQKGSGGGRGVKEKNKDDDAKAVVSPSVNDEPVVKEKQSSLVDTSIPNIENTGLRSVAYRVVANYVRNTWGKYGLVKSMFNSSTGLFTFQFSSMDGLDAMLENGPWFIPNNPLILKKWNPDVNLLKEDVSNIPVWVKLHGVPMTAFSEDGLSVVATKLGTPLMLDSYTSDMCMQSWGRSSYARAMIELRADVELKDTIVVAMPKIAGEGFYTYTIRVEYEWKPHRCVCCKVFGHIQEECPKNIGSGEAKNLKKPSQTPQGVPIGLKKGVEPTKEVSNSNPFDVLNSVENDVKLGTNGGISNLASNEVNSSGSSFWNVETSSTSTTPIVDYPGDHDSEDEVESVDNDIARSMASERVGFGTKSLLKQWRDTYKNGDYDENPYDDDMYEGQDFPDKIQHICDNLDIRVRAVQCSPAAKYQSSKPIHARLPQAITTEPPASSPDCDSNPVYLYPVTQQPSSTTTFALISLSPTTWHRRLGHPSEDVLRRLESSRVISYNKTKLSTLCHACQLGKHTRLPFYSSRVECWSGI